MHVCAPDLLHVCCELSNCCSCLAARWHVQTNGRGAARICSWHWCPTSLEHVGPEFLAALLPTCSRPRAHTAPRFRARAQLAWHSARHRARSAPAKRAFCKYGRQLQNPHPSRAPSPPPAAPCPPRRIWRAMPVWNFTQPLVILISNFRGGVLFRTRVFRYFLVGTSHEIPTSSDFLLTLYCDILPLYIYCPLANKGVSDLSGFTHKMAYPAQVVK